MEVSLDIFLLCQLPQYLERCSAGADAFALRIRDHQIFRAVRQHVFFLPIGDLAAKSFCLRLIG